MSTLVTRAALAALIAVGGMAGVSAPALAQSIQLEIGPDGVRPIAPEQGRYRDRDRDRRADRRGDEGCSPRQALRAARAEGLRDAEVVRVTRRTITVEGDTRRGPETIRFANEPGCPEI